MRTLLLLLALAVMTGCAVDAGGQGDGSDVDPVVERGVESVPADGDRSPEVLVAPAPGEDAPPFTVVQGEASLMVSPYAYCLPAEDGSRECFEDFPSSDPVLPADGRPVVVTYFEGELAVDASETFTGAVGSRSESPRTAVPVESLEPGVFAVDVSGLDQGDHALWLSWTGAEGTASAVLTLALNFEPTR